MPERDRPDTESNKVMINLQGSSFHSSGLALKNSALSEVSQKHFLFSICGQLLLASEKSNCQSRPHCSLQSFPHQQPVTEQQNNELSHCQGLIFHCHFPSSVAWCSAGSTWSPSTPRAAPSLLLQRQKERTQGKEIQNIQDVCPRNSTPQTRKALKREDFVPYEKVALLGLKFHFVLASGSGLVFFYPSVFLVIVLYFLPWFIWL